jgi:hypothetical protein
MGAGRLLKLSEVADVAGVEARDDDPKGVREVRVLDVVVEVTPREWVVGMVTESRGRIEREIVEREGIRFFFHSLDGDTRAWLMSVLLQMKPSLAANSADVSVQSAGSSLDGEADKAQQGERHGEERRGRNDTYGTGRGCINDTKRRDA